MNERFLSRNCVRRQMGRNWGPLPGMSGRGDGGEGAGFGRGWGMGGWGAFAQRRGGWGGGKGFAGPGGPRFGRGDIKYVLLDLLRERPKHGYEMIKELEERSAGFYSPSPGSVYPTLQLLEDSGYVTSASSEGKKVYTITDQGRTFLEQNTQERGQHGPAFAKPGAGEQPWGNRGNWGPWAGHGGHDWHGGRWGEQRGQTFEELQALQREGRELAGAVMQGARATGGNPEKIAQLRAILANAKQEIYRVLGSQQGTPAQQQAVPQEHPNFPDMKNDWD